VNNDVLRDITYGLKSVMQSRTVTTTIPLREAD